jgi:hypothetical protein
MEDIIFVAEGTAVGNWNSKCIKELGTFVTCFVDVLVTVIFMSVNNG